MSQRQYHVLQSSTAPVTGALLEPGSVVCLDPDSPEVARLVALNAIQDVGEGSGEPGGQPSQDGGRVLELEAKVAQLEDELARAGVDSVAGADPLVEWFSHRKRLDSLTADELRDLAALRRVELADSAKKSEIVAAVWRSFWAGPTDPEEAVVALWEQQGA